jgi:hypothetical protein
MNIFEGQKKRREVRKLQKHLQDTVQCAMTVINFLEEHLHANNKGANAPFSRIEAKEALRIWIRRQLAEGDRVMASIEVNEDIKSLILASLDTKIAKSRPIIFRVQAALSQIEI